jgi:CheY-like chemotaxis protein
LAYAIPQSGTHTASGKRVTAGNEEPSQLSLKILVAEDEPISRLFLTKVLTKMGHEVRSAKSGEEVLEILAGKEKFDALLTDIQMPALNGIELTQRLRSDGSYRSHAQITIIAMTAYAISGDREKFLRAGMDDYLPKPIDPKLLTIILEQVISKPQ